MISRFVNWVRAFFYAHVTVYYRYYLFSNRIDIRNSDETLDFILNNRVSVSRFGDGEIDVICGGGNGMQQPDSSLANRLSEVLSSTRKGHIVCIPYSWKCKRGIKTSNRLFWTHYVAQHYSVLCEMLNFNYKYYNASFTRFYMDAEMSIKHSKEMDEYVKRMKQIWANRDVCIIEGGSTRFGVGNDFLSGANSVRRVICPAKDAFSKYDEIVSAVKENVSTDTLVLCALGMTATVLAYDLSKMGYQAIDIGHADIEYEWFLRGVDKKVLIQGKAVNELGVQVVGDDEAVDDNMVEYSGQIICRIS